MVLIIPVNVWQSVAEATYSIGSKTNVSKSIRKKKTKGKQEKGVLWLWKIQRVQLLLFVFHWLGGGGVIVGGLVLVRLRLVLTKLV